MHSQNQFQHFYRDHYHGVFCFFRSRKFGEEDAHELAQETFLKVYRGLEGFRGETAPETYLKIIAANVWRNALREKAAKKRDGWEVALSESTTPVSNTQKPLASLLEAEAKAALRNAIAQLPERMRHCLVLRTYQDLKYREIAGLMRLNIQTVKSMLGQARMRLRENLSDYFK